MRTIASLITNIVAVIAFVIACEIDNTNLFIVSIFMVVNSIYWKGEQVMTEEWRAIPLEELLYYEASSKGNIRDANKKLRNQWFCDGYKYVGLKRKDGSHRPYRVNRLIAAAFLGYYEGLVVDHKDGNRTNNNIENLVWCTQKENCNREIHRNNVSFAALNGKRNRKKIYKLSKDGEIVSVYESAKQAARENKIFIQNISACCLGKIKSCAGFIWRYAI